MATNTSEINGGLEARFEAAKAAIEALDDYAFENGAKISFDYGTTAHDYVGGTLGARQTTQELSEFRDLPSFVEPWDPSAWVCS